MWVFEYFTTFPELRCQLNRCAVPFYTAVYFKTSDFFHVWFGEMVKLS